MAINSKPLTDILRQAEDGRFIEDATEDFNRLVDKVIELGKPGVMTIQIGVEPDGRKTIALHVKATMKEPRLNRVPTTFFIDRHNTLVRDDPAQPKLPFKEVHKDNNVRSIDDATPIRTVND
jgi:hypothetical protein